MKTLFTLSALAAALSTQAQSQSTPSPALPDVTVTGERGVATPLLLPSTAGSRLGLTPFETPASVAVVPGELIRKLGAASVVEAKTLASGITSANSPGNGGNLLNARGFTGQNSVKQLYNGLEILNAGGVVSFPFDPWGIERIEVLYGPASVLYGTGAIGGAVNVISKQPNPDKAKHEVALGFGSFNARQQSFSSTGPLGGGVSYSLDVSHRSSDGWIDRGQSETLALSSALRWDATDTLRFTLRTDYGRQNPTHYLGTPVFQGAPAPGTRFKNYNIADNDLFFEDRWLTLATDWTPSDDLSVHNDSYSLRHQRRYRDIQTFTYQPATGLKNATVTRTLYRDIGYSLQQQIGTNTYAKTRGSLFGLKNEFLAGFQLNHGTYDRQDTIRGGNTVVDALNPVPGLYLSGYKIQSSPQYFMTLNQAGIFFENRLAVSDRVSAVLGLRVDDYRNNRKDLITGAVTDSRLRGVSSNAGVVFNPVPEVALYGQVATASDPVTSLVSIGANQQGFRLSKGRQVEAGIKQTLLNGRLDWTLAAYQLVKKDLLTANALNPTISEQVGQQSSRGIEASVSARLGTWRVEANGTVLDPKFDDFKAQVGSTVQQLAGNVPMTVPKRSANLAVFWDFSPSWTASGVAQYMGQRFVNNTNTAALPPYTVFNFGLGWQPMPKLAIDLRLNNAFDKVYASQGATTQWLLGQPRTVFLSSTYAF